MLRFIGLMAVVSISFAGGYYFGQRPVGTLLKTVSDLQQSVKDLSRSVLDTTTGIEHDLQRRQGLVEAKSRLVQAKVNIMERNFGEAEKNLGETIAVLEEAMKGVRSDDDVKNLKTVISSLQNLRSELTKGKSVPRRKLDAVQHRLDQLLKQ